MLLGESLIDDVPDDREVVRLLAGVGASVQIVESHTPLSRQDCRRVYQLRLLSLSS